MAALVGRARELALVTAWLASARQGQGVVALVAGEPGIGKTRLLEAAAGAAAVEGVVPVWGRAWEVSSAPPYWPWIEALRELVARDAAGSDDLVAALPEIARRPRTATTDDPLRLYDALLGYLQVASARTPIAIFLEDLHAADPSSVRLAELVAPHVRRMHVLLVGSMRELEARRSPDVERVMTRLARRAETIRLERLDLTSTGTLVRAHLGRDDRETTRMIHEASDGNPLFVHELLKLLGARSALPQDVPAGVRTVLRERFALLSPATVALLQAAAILGRTFGLAVPAALAGVTPAALEDAIAEALDAEIVERLEPGRYRFSHALVAETLVTELAPALRARLHRRAAELLEQRHAGEPAVLGEIARHWLAAGAESATRAVDAACDAARAADAQLAFGDAAELYEHALAALAIAAPDDARRRVELLVRQGEAYVRAGDRERALQPCQLAAALAQALGDGTLLARAALAFGADAAVAQVLPALIELLERALAALPPTDDPWRAKVLARLAAARQPAEDSEALVQLARDAIAMVRRVGTEDDLLDVLFSAGGALVDFAPPDERALVDAETVALARVRGNRARTLRALQRLAFDHVERGDLAAFERTVGEYEAIAAATKQLRYQWVPPMFRSMRAFWEGRHDEAERIAATAYAIREELGDESVGVIARYRTHAQSQLAHAGDDLEPIIAAMASRVEHVARLVRGCAMVAAGRLGDAARELAWIRAHALGPHFPSIHLFEHLSILAWQFDDTVVAAHHYDHVLPYAGRPIVVSSAAFMLVGVADHGLMRTAAVLGRFEAAERHAEAALAFCRKLGATVIEARILADRAAMRARRGVAVAPVPVVPPAVSAVALVLEGEVWTVQGHGELCRIKDSRGMQMLAQLVANPSSELHVLELSGAEAVDTGDAGAAIDPVARRQYQARIVALREAIEEATAWNDGARRGALEAELEALTDQLASAFGLGGRERKAGNAVERARSNVRRRIADAMARIASAAPAIGRHLEVAVRTGTTCRYDPDRGRPA